MTVDLSDSTDPGGSRVRSDHQGQGVRPRGSSGRDGSLDQGARPTAIGWLGSTSGITDDGQLFVMARFESEKAATANSDRPEQGEWFAEMAKLYDGEPSFQDSTDVTVETIGDLDSAGFVQVMSGQVSDPTEPSS